MSFLARQLVKNIINSVGAMMPPRPSIQFVGLSPTAITDSPSLNATIIDLSAIAGGGITQLTGDVLAGAGSGSQSATVVRINGATVPVAGSLTDGAVLQVSGAGALTYAAVNLALAAAVTGVLGVANGGTGLSTGGSNTQVLTWVSGAPAWAAAPSGSFTAAQDLSGSSTSQEVVGLLTHALPSLSTGYLNWTGSAWALSSVSGGGITALTADVTASGTGSVAATVVNLTGASGVVGMNGETIRWVTGATSPGLSQVVAAGAGANFTISPQAATTGASGSLIVTLAPPGSGSTEAQFQVSRTGGASMAFSSDGSGDAFFFLNAKNVLQVNASSLYVGDGTGTVFLIPGGTTMATILGTGNMQILPGSAGDFGGGAYVLGINACVSPPTTAVSTPGDIVLYGEAVSGQSFMGILASGILFNAAAASSGTFKIIPLPPTTGNGNSIWISGGAPGGGGGAGEAAMFADDLSAGVQVTRSFINITSATGGSIVIDAAGGAVPVALSIGINTTGAVALGNTGASSTSVQGATVAMTAASGSSVALGTDVVLNASTAFVFQGGAELELNGMTVVSSASAGSASALPALPVEYLEITRDGNARKIPLYAA